MKVTCCTKIGRRGWGLALVLAFALAGATADAEAAAFLKLEGINGEATHAGEGGYVELQSVSWGPSGRQTPPESPSGPGQIVVTKRQDRTTPALAEAQTRRTRIREATLSVPTAPGSSEYMTITLKDVLVTSVQAPDGPTETVTFTFQDIKMTPHVMEMPDREDPVKGRRRGNR